ncbi:hypothetical protein NAU58_18295 [Pseudomonas stutzeri]|uniref:Phytanoyl-CoA dioxygenase n=1 Tax=Stutzerimonas stutzeri TaxID=316 RepID=A0A2N8RZ69_STUST|nr:hypothetical protein [Stutzerimonas stutzeri]MCQ4297533.1 hypothetical protein [Stutzerimonas stutzeri]PNF79670.1 hypothetical protein CXK92_13560 [Stutzerimonas stutzeri]
MEDQDSAQIARDINQTGYACLPSYLSPDQLSQLRDQVNIQARQHHGQYFAHHDGEQVAGSLLAVLGAAPEFQALLDEIYRFGARRPAHSSRIYMVMRCVQGETGRKESNCFHFDASLVTALLPVEIPQEGEERGDLLLFPNLRGIRKYVLFNVLEKAILQNGLSRKLIARAIAIGLLKPQRLQLVPGNLYLFWGYRSLHANEPCDPAKLRATAIFHYGDPHAGSLLTRMILRHNQRRAKRASVIGTQQAI